MASQSSQTPPGTVEISAQGNLLTVKPNHNVKGVPSRGDRAESNEFTSRSRLNLLRTFARIKAPDSKGYRGKVSMLTLTMRDIVHPREAKKLFFTFLKRWRRKYAPISGLWKMEFQERGAPHFHMIMYNAGWIPKEDIQESWGKIIGQEKPFTRIERINNYRQGMKYVAKYLGKLEDGGFNYDSNLTGEVQSIGRRWGVFNRRNVPWADKTDATIALDGSWWLIRSYCATFWDVLEERDYLGFCLFHDEPVLALNHIVSLARQFAAVQ